MEINKETLEKLAKKVDVEKVEKTVKEALSNPEVKEKVEGIVEKISEKGPEGLKSVTEKLSKLTK